MNFDSDILQSLNTSQRYYLKKYLSEQANYSKEEIREEPKTNDVLQSVIDLLNSTIDEIDNNKLTSKDMREILSDAEATLSSLQNRM